jgi:hypothetical protein
MDLIQHARELYVAGRMHDALQAAQAACDRAPKDPEAWSLLGRISRHTGLRAASDEAFRRASQLDSRQVLPYRVSADRFKELVGAAAGPQTTAARTLAMPTADLVRAGVDPDALTHRDRAAPHALVLFQVNHENRCAGEDDLRALIGRSLASG